MQLQAKREVTPQHSISAAPGLNMPLSASRWGENPNKPRHTSQGTSNHIRESWDVILALQEQGLHGFVRVGVVEQKWQIEKIKR